MSITEMSQTPITLIVAPEVICIPVQECHEAFVDIRDLNTIAYGPSPEIEDNTNYTYMRQSVYEKLLYAGSLLPKGIHFCLYEAYRSLDLQKMIFEEQFSNVQRRHPDWSAEAVFEDTIRLASPIINQDGSINIPPHSTGAAIDVYLVDEEGDALDMGIHPKDWMLDKDGVLSLTASAMISAQAQSNRHIMSEVLSTAGFVNYPTEYWHWSYGDKYWAFMMEQPHAIFGSAVP